MLRNCIIVDVCKSKGTVSGEQTNATVCGQTYLFGHQKVPIVWVNRSLPTIVHPIVLVRPALGVVVLELQYDVREAVYGVELFRSISLNLVEVHVGADSSWGVRSAVSL